MQCNRCVEIGIWRKNFGDSWIFHLSCYETAIWRISLVNCECIFKIAIWRKKMNKLIFEIIYKDVSCYATAIWRIFHVNSVHFILTFQFEGKFVNFCTLLWSSDLTNFFLNFWEFSIDVAIWALAEISSILGFFFNSIKQWFDDIFLFFVCSLNNKCAKFQFDGQNYVLGSPIA